MPSSLSQSRSYLILKVCEQWCCQTLKKAKGELCAYAVAVQMRACCELAHTLVPPFHSYRGADLPVLRAHLRLLRVVLLFVVQPEQREDLGKRADSDRSLGRQTRPQFAGAHGVVRRELRARLPPVLHQIVRKHP